MLFNILRSFVIICCIGAQHIEASKDHDVALVPPIFQVGRDYYRVSGEKVDPALVQNQNISNQIISSMGTTSDQNVAYVSCPTKVFKTCKTKIDTCLDGCVNCLSDLIWFVCCCNGCCCKFVDEDSLFRGGNFRFSSHFSRDSYSCYDGGCFGGHDGGCHDDSDGCD